jgi:molybdate transport system ATP-binding protein
MTDHAPASTAPELLYLEGVSLTYRARPVLRALRWRVQAGEQWALVGPNGAGKTTLAGLLSGEQRHYAGQLSLAPELSERGVAYVCFERARTLMERDRKLDVAEYSADASDHGTRVRDLLPADADPALRDAWIERLAMTDFLDRGLRYVSTGQMRKALLVAAILAKPGLLILDSPLDGLDRDSRLALGAALADLLGTAQPVLLLARELADIPEPCSHVLALDRGRILVSGKRAEVFADPQVQSLMRGPTPTFEALPRRARDDTPCSSDTVLIELRDVSVSFGDTRVLHDVHWRFGAGDHCCLSGPNGCGKTTLLGLVSGDNHKAYGQDVSLFGRRRGSGESVWDIKRHFGRVDTGMQFSIAAGMSTLEVVISGFFDAHGLYDDWSDEQRHTALDWLRALGLIDLQYSAFDTLSFGLQRMVLLARAMVKSPRILVLDEPTLGLDSHHRALLLDAIDHIAAGGATQLLFVSHSPADLPRCINQHLRFVPAAPGYTTVCESAPLRG